jgi:hypothetical protein
VISEKIHNFRSISELQKYLDNTISTLKLRSDELSNTIGEKLRVTDSTDATELQEFRNKIEGGTNDPKKRKSTTKKKDQRSNWHSMESISIYDGLGIKGDLEIHFKVLEQTKSELERITKVKQAIDDLANKGLRDDLGGVFVLHHESIAEIAFRKSQEHKKFAFKAIFTVPKEEYNVIQI